MNLGLVLGAGGTVGVSFHIGALRALQTVAGLSPAAADLVVGTSAGSIVAAYVRAGYTVEELWSFAHGVHPRRDEPFRPADRRAAQRAMMAPAWSTRSELARRGVGSAYVMARSIVRLPMGGVAPERLARRFPAGLFEMAEGRRRFAEDLPAEWPSSPLWVCAVDLGTGRRVVLGREGSPEVPLPTAVVASCAIPGVFPPVRLGSTTLVDGGVRSPTNLDLAVRFGCDLVIGVAPTTFDPAHPPAPLRRLRRELPARALAVEVAGARAAGARVLLVRPGVEELRTYGYSSMRPGAPGVVARAAYDVTARLLDTPAAREVLAGGA